MHPIQKTVQHPSIEIGTGLPDLITLVIGVVACVRNPRRRNYPDVKVMKMMKYGMCSERAIIATITVPLLILNRMLVKQEKMTTNTVQFCL